MDLKPALRRAQEVIVLLFGAALIYFGLTKIARTFALVGLDAQMLVQVFGILIGAGLAVSSFLILRSGAYQGTPLFVQFGLLLLSVIGWPLLLSGMGLVDSSDEPENSKQTRGAVSASGPCATGTQPCVHLTDFAPFDGDSSAPVTRFGGQPVWINTPQWPIHSTGESESPMQFIAQIQLDTKVFGQLPGEVAYIFYTGDGEDWEPHWGRNAVIVQSTSQLFPPSSDIVKVAELRTGPSVSEAEPYRPTCIFGFEPPSLPEDAGTEDEDARIQAVDVCKIGGESYFFQGDAQVDGGPWRLLLQIDSMTTPFDLHFGDGGVGYALLHEDGTKGCFLWQSC
jgi:hypothetical protein